MLSSAKFCVWGTLALGLCLASTALAGEKHPGYLRARDDLRLARALLQRSNATEALNNSQDEVSLTVAGLGVC